MLFHKNNSRLRNIIQEKLVTMVEEKDNDIILAILVILQNNEVKKRS